MKHLNKRPFTYLLVALFGLSLTACASYDDRHDDAHYEEGYYDDDGYARSRTYRRHRDRRYDPYYDSRYDAYYDPYYDRYYSRYRGAYYDPFYNRYYYYGAGSYGRYGYFRRGHGYYCPTHSGYYGRTHYHTHDHRGHGETIRRDRNAEIRPNSGAVMDSSRRGSSANTDSRRTPRTRVVRPNSNVDGVVGGGSRVAPRAKPRIEMDDREIQNRLAQIRAQQAEQRQRGEVRTNTRPQTRQREVRPREAQPRPEVRQRQESRPQVRETRKPAHIERRGRPNRQIQ